MEFTEDSGSLNPLNGVDVGYRSNIAFLDANGDGLPDAFIGEEDGNINYFENTGTSDSWAFTERTGSLNPLNGVDVGTSTWVFKRKPPGQVKGGNWPKKTGGDWPTLFSFDRARRFN